MDQITTPSTPQRKVRFIPKPPPRRKQVLAVPDNGDDKDDDKAAAAADVKSQEAFIRRVNDNIARQRPKAEKKTPVQVAFTQAPGSATTMRTYGKSKDQKNGSSSKSSVASDGRILVSSSSTGTNGYPLNDVDTSYQKKRKDYKEPWDYNNSYYPTTLPLRRPYSGNPELLDEAEFGLSGMHLEYDEKSINPASDLGLLEKSDQTQIIFLQLPAKLPLDRPSARTMHAKGGTPNLEPVDRKEILVRSLKGKSVAGGSSGGSPSAAAAAKGKETGDSSSGGSPSAAKGKVTDDRSVHEARRNAGPRNSSFRDLPQGYMGKMLVYKSGAIKWKIGEIIYDVFPGESCIFPQDVVAINTKDKNCCVVGEISKRAVLTPDMDFLLADKSDWNNNISSQSYSKG